MDSSRRRLAVASALLGAVFAIGTVGVYVIGSGRWSLMDCAYFVLITLSSVGYGETIPIASVPAARVFTMALIVSGMGVLLYFVSTLTAFIVEGQLQHLLRRRRMERRIAKLDQHLILCGAGRMGRSVALEFHVTKERFVVIDRGMDALERLDHDIGAEILHVHGNAVEDETLTLAGVERARGLVACLSTDQDNLFVTISAKSLNPDVRVVARALERATTDKLKLAGAKQVVQVNAIGGLRLASEMIRPEVTGFLDHMMRDPDRTLRIEEIPVRQDSRFVGKQLSESEIRRASDVLVIAVRKNTGLYHYNPGPTYPIMAGETLIVIGDPSEVRTLRAL